VSETGREEVNMPQKRLSEAQAAKKLGYAVSTLANWRSMGYGPPFLKISRRVEYLESDIEEWQLAQRRVPGEEAS
jgi:predicted DNA-binding transcriptional regulator AlpA